MPARHRVHQLALAFLLLSSSAAADTVLVHVGLATIQAGIDSALPGDTVAVGAGTYRGPGNRDIALRGKDLVVMSVEGAAATVIDCEFAGRAFWIHEGEGPATVIQGFTIINGYLASENGGGIYLNGCSPTLRDIRIQSCQAVHGGAIEAVHGSMRFESLILEGNSTFGAGTGGGLSLAFAEIFLEQCSIIGNTANAGGGIAAYDVELSITNLVVEANTAGTAGGIRAIASSLDIQGSVFADNQAITNYAGALYLSSCEALSSVRDSQFYRNSAGTDGGAIYLNQCGNVVIERVLFQENHSTGTCAISSNYFSSPCLNNITCVANYNDDSPGGAVVGSWHHSTVTLQNSVVAFNSDIGVAAQSPATVAMVCCDVYGNEGGNYGWDLEDQTGSNGNIALDPLFCADANPQLPWSLSDSSPCLPEGNDCEVLMGAFGDGCTVTGVGGGSTQSAAWSTVKGLY